MVLTVSPACITLFGAAVSPRPQLCTLLHGSVLPASPVGDVLIARAAARAAAPVWIVQCASVEVARHQTPRQGELRAALPLDFGRLPELVDLRCRHAELLKRRAFGWTRARSGSFDSHVTEYWLLCLLIHLRPLTPGAPQSRPSKYSTTHASKPRITLT